jgi:hypothetical protein
MTVFSTTYTSYQVVFFKKTAPFGISVLNTLIGMNEHIFVGLRLHTTISSEPITRSALAVLFIVQSAT